MKKVFLFLLSALFLASCGEEIKRKSMGAPFEVMLVCEDDVWDSTAGIAIEQALATPIPGLPQKESSFKVTRRPGSGFGTTEQAYRNIILVDVDSSHSKCEFRFEKNLYASPQIVMAIYAPDQKSFGDYVNRNARVIVDFFTEKEREGQIAELAGKHNKQALALMKEKFGCELRIPSNISGYKQGEDFLWFSDYNNPSKVEMQSFAVYSYPYTSTDNFSKEHFIHMRDSVMKENIPGGEPDSYIQTDAATVTLTDVAYNGKYMSVARGLWYMKNDDMFGGGPFVSHSIVDEENGNVIVVEAFVYAPNKAKGGFMRKLESSLHTLRLPVDLATANNGTTENNK
jgi:hypothetical protein